MKKKRFLPRALQSSWSSSSRGLTVLTGRMQLTARPPARGRGSFAALHMLQHFCGLPDVLALPLNYPPSIMLRNIPSPWTYKSFHMRTFIDLPGLSDVESLVQHGTFGFSTPRHSACGRHPDRSSSRQCYRGHAPPAHIQEPSPQRRHSAKGQPSRRSQARHVGFEGASGVLHQLVCCSATSYAYPRPYARFRGIYGANFRKPSQLVPHSGSLIDAKLRRAHGHRSERPDAHPVLVRRRLCRYWFHLPDRLLGRRAGT